MQNYTQLLLPVNPKINEINLLWTKLDFELFKKHNIRLNYYSINESDTCEMFISYIYNNLDSYCLNQKLMALDLLKLILLHYKKQWG